MDGEGPQLGSHTGPCRSGTHGQGKGTGNASAVCLPGGRRGCAPGCAHVRRCDPGQLRGGGPVDPHQPPPGRRPGAAHSRVPYHRPAQREVDPALQPVQVRRTLRRQGGHPHVLRGVQQYPLHRGPARRRRLLGLFRAKHRAKRHARFDAGVRACGIPLLGVAPTSRHQGPASQPHPHRLRGRAGLHRGREVPGCPHRRRTRPGDRRRRLLHAGRDVRGHRPCDPGVQPRMAYSAGQPRQGRARRLLEGRADQRAHPDFLDATWRGDPKVASLFY